MPEGLSTYSPKLDYFLAAADEAIAVATQGMAQDGVEANGDLTNVREEVGRGINADLVLRMRSIAEQHGLTEYLRFLRGPGFELSWWDDFDAFHDQYRDAIARSSVSEDNNTPKEARIIATGAVDLVADEAVSRTWRESVLTARRLLGDAAWESRSVPERGYRMTSLAAAAAGSTGKGCLVAMLGLAASALSVVAAARGVGR